MKMYLSLCGIQGQTQLHCCHQLHSATISVCVFGVSMHSMLVDMGLSIGCICQNQYGRFCRHLIQTFKAQSKQKSGVNKEMDCKSGPQSKAERKSLQPTSRVTRSTRQKAQSKGLAQTGPPLFQHYIVSCCGQILVAITVIISCDHQQSYQQRQFVNVLPAKSSSQA